MIKIKKVIPKFKILFVTKIINQKKVAVNKKKVAVNKKKVAVNKKKVAVNKKKVAVSYHNTLYILKSF
jgi:16S rRNA U516 pseudouridylate synthase RsuA-like enzyme